MSAPNDFDGKTVLITGAGSGFGRASAELFASQGARIIVVDRQEDRAAEVVSRLPGGNERGHAAIVRDLRPAPAAADIVASALKIASRIDVLVNSAGVCHFTRIETIAPDEWDEVMEIDTRALFYMATHVAEAMKRDGLGGSIINLGSNAGRKGRALSAHYAAAKAAVNSISESLALAYGPDGIRVNTVSPAVVLTSMWNQNFEELGRIAGKTPGELQQFWTDQTPLRRLGTPEDIANLIVFLASDKGAFITGQNINVCGGFMHTC
jgi:NAD(P)-dependent dehydrogenase (short-subunit alcohol dehydrogenase family)